MAKYQDKASSSESSLIGRNVVIESNKAIHTGMISFLEGNIFEVEFAQYKYYELGDEVKVVVYSLEGLVRFYTTVIGRDKDVIILIIPPKAYDLIRKKRQYPRIQIESQAWIYSITDPKLDVTRQLDPKPQIVIQDLSFGGIAFTSDLEFQLKSYVYMELFLDTSYLCMVEIIHSQKTEYGGKYGAKFLDISTDKSYSLRAFIVKYIVEERFENKRLELENNLKGIMAN